MVFPYFSNLLMFILFCSHHVTDISGFWRTLLIYNGVCQNLQRCHFGENSAAYTDILPPPSNVMESALLAPMQMLSAFPCPSLLIYAFSSVVIISLAGAL